MTWRNPDERLAETCETLERLIRKKECPEKKFLASFTRKLRNQLAKPETITDEMARAGRLMVENIRMGIRYRKLRKAGAIESMPYFESKKRETSLSIGTADSIRRELRQIVQAGYPAWARSLNIRAKKQRSESC